MHFKAELENYICGCRSYLKSGEGFRVSNLKVSGSRPWFGGGGKQYKFFSSFFFLFFFFVVNAWFLGRVVSASPLPPWIRHCRKKFYRNILSQNFEIRLDQTSKYLKTIFQVSESWLLILGRDSDSVLFLEIFDQKKFSSKFGHLDLKRI